MEDIKKAIEALKYHQEWRKGAEIPQTDVKELTNALDTAIEILSKWEESERWRKVEGELPENNEDVLGRGKSGKIVVVFYSNIDKCFLSNTTYDVSSITEWKPIY